MMTKFEYNEYISALRYWNVEAGHFDPLTGKHVKQDEFRRQHNKNFYQLSHIMKSVSQEALMEQHWSN